MPNPSTPAVKRLAVFFSLLLSTIFLLTVSVGTLPAKGDDQPDREAPSAAEEKKNAENERKEEKKSDDAEKKEPKEKEPEEKAEEPKEVANPEKKDQESPENKAKNETKSESGQKTEDKPKSSGEPQADDKTESKPETGSGPKSESKPVAKPESKSESKAESKAEPKPDTIELKKEPFRLTNKINGVFESKRAETVRLKGEDFSTFELKEVVPHGSKVRQGDVLIRFNSKKYEEAFREKKRALRLSELSLREEEISLKYLGKRRPLQKEARERDKQYEDEDFVYFLNVELNWVKRLLGFQQKVMRFNLESVQEELKQLEKMYEADDLVEETEEFILKRTRFMVELQEFRNEMTQMQLDRTEETTLPRAETSMKHDLKLRQLDFDAAKETFDFVLEQARLRFERTREAHDKLVEQFEKFTKDRRQLTLEAPCDGMVYYGEYNAASASGRSSGKWNGAAMVASGMKTDENVMNKQILFTIVDPKPTRLRAAVAEKDLHWIGVGTRGTVQPTAFPNIRYPVRVAERDEVPSVSNTFGALLTVELPDDCGLFPNMTGSIELIVYDKPETILVPTTALKREELEDDSWNHAYAYVYGDDKTVERIKVATGPAKGDKTEILDGIAVGAKVLKRYDDGEKWIQREKERQEKEEKNRTKTIDTVSLGK